MEPSLALILYAFASVFAFTNADETPVGSLYAYGQNISGLPLFYADGRYHDPRNFILSLTMGQASLCWATVIPQVSQPLPTCLVCDSGL
jgi:hypothetical protein